MAMLAPVTMKCKRCLTEISRKSPIEKCGTGPADYAHVGCVAPSPAAKMILQGSTPKVSDLENAISQATQSYSVPSTQAKPATDLDAGIVWEVEALFSGQKVGGLSNKATMVVDGKNKAEFSRTGLASGQGDTMVEDLEDVSGEGEVAGGEGMSTEAGEVETQGQSSGSESGDQDGEGSGGESGSDEAGDEGEGSGSEPKAQGQGDADEQGDIQGGESGTEEGDEEGEDDTDTGEKSEGDTDTDEGDEQGEDHDEQDDKEGDEQAEKKQEKQEEKKTPPMTKDELMELVKMAARMAAEIVKRDMPQAQPGKMDASDIIDKSSKIAARLVSDAMANRVGQTVGAAVSAVMPKFEQKVKDGVSGKLDEEAKRQMESLAKKLDKQADEVAKKAQAKLNATLAKLDEKREVIHKFEQQSGEVIQIDGEVLHEKFERIRKLVMARFNVFLVGPTGAGKTHTAKKIAESLGMEFGLISGTAGTTESEFFGTSVPNIATGTHTYQESDFIRLYENGGVFLLDEADALDPNCFLKVNAALSNGYCSVPKRYGNTIAKKHPDFVCIVAANTWGQGATRLYCGRNKLDEATLDRFRAGTVEFNYDPKIEEKLCPDQALYSMLAGWRKAIFENSLQRVISTRYMIQAYELKHKMGDSDDEIARNVSGSWSPAERMKVFGRDVCAA